MRVGSQLIELPGSVAKSKPGLAAYAGRPLMVGLRPEHMSAASGDWTGPVLTGEVNLTEGLGSQLLVHFTIDASRARTDDVRAAAEEEVTESELTSVGEGIAVVDSRAPINSGTRARFAVDIDRLHFFDPATGAAISPVAA